MRRRPVISRKANFVVLFKTSKRRLTGQTDDIARLPSARIVSATLELNQIVDDIRDAQCVPDKPPRTVRKEPPPTIHTVGKILRRSKSDS